MDELLSQLLDTIFDALPVMRGFVVTLDTNTGDPEIHASRSREAEVSDGPPLSRTLIRHVLEQKGAMLTLDAMDDSRFDASQSIMRFGIHAAMCAPLVGREL